MKNIFIIGIMLTPTLRTGSELSTQEKTDIIARMSATQNQQERDRVRNALVKEYGVSEGTIASLIAHETMRRKRSSLGSQQDSLHGEGISTLNPGESAEENTTQTVQEFTQARVYSITSLSGITEDMRVEIIEEFSEIIQDNITNSRYDFYQDIEAISDDYSVDPVTLEQFLRNRYSWLGVKLDELKNGRILNAEDKLNIRLYVSEGTDEKDKKARRKEMAQKYGVSTYVIGAITAWKLGKRGRVVLKKDRTEAEPS